MLDCRLLPPLETLLDRSRCGVADEIFRVAEYVKTNGSFDLARKLERKKEESRQWNPSALNERIL